MPTVRWLARWGLRRDRLCPGVEQCIDARDKHGTGKKEACVFCRGVIVDGLMHRTMAGQLLLRVLDIESAKAAGVRFSSEEVFADEIKATNILASERSRFEKEEDIRRKQNLEIDRHQQEALQRGGSVRTNHPYR